jgi:hypothetical protein
MPRAEAGGSLQPQGVSQPFQCCDKIPEVDNLREEGFLLAHSFRGFSPWLLAPLLWACVKQTLWQGGSGGCSPHGIQEAESNGKRKGPGTTYTLWRNPHPLANDPLPPARPHSCSCSAGNSSVLSLSIDEVSTLMIQSPLKSPSAGIHAFGRDFQT